MRYAASTRTFLMIGLVMGVVQSMCIIIQAISLAKIITGLFFDHKDLSEFSNTLWLLISAIVIRALVTWVVDVSAQRASAQVKSELRTTTFKKALELGPMWMNSTKAVETTTLLTRGIDALDVYFSKYLPSLLLASIAPIILGVVVATQDLLSALIILLTIPLIPFFMILIGKLTSDRVKKQWSSLSQLSQHFADLISGLPTLRIFGQSKNQRQALISNGKKYQDSTMSVLRISFLSALVLELIATLSVALIAVSIGLRLITGSIGLEAGLIILILAPDIYLPIRQVGMNFHAAADGLEAASRIFEILEAESNEDSNGTITECDWSSPIRFTDAAIGYSIDGAHVVRGVNLTCSPATITALVGPSGSGKSTILNSLLKFLPLQVGTLTIGDIDIAQVDAQALRRNITYLPQRPWVPAGTLENAVKVGQPSASREEIVHACSAAGLTIDGSDSSLAHGIDTVISAGGDGISAGQLRRIGIARTLLSNAQIVIMDEPTAALDAQTENLVISTLQKLRDAGKTVIVVAHRSSVIAIADQAVDLSQWSQTLRTTPSHEVTGS